jgi:hypothetical protein
MTEAHQQPPADPKEARIKEAMWRVVDYLYLDEKNNYFGSDSDDRIKHIFGAVMVLALESGYMTQAQLDALHKEIAELDAQETEGGEA